MKTAEEIREKSEEVFPVDIDYVSHGKIGDATAVDTLKRSRQIWVSGAKWANQFSQSSMEVEIERRAEEKLNDYKKQISDILSRLDHSGRKESIIGVLRVEYVPWQTILHEFEKLGIKFEHPF